ncbi:MAG: tRNA uracil 4-sulfurtransferase ThiI [Clostridia bacterium]
MQVIVIRYSEIHLKGRNRGYFENALVRNIKVALQDFNCQLSRLSTRYIVSGFESTKQEQIVARLKNVFGINSLSVANVTPTNLDDITKACMQVAKSSGTFKIITNRADKTFPLNSMEISCEIGGRLLDANPNISVDIHAPDWSINIDVREGGQTLVYSNTMRCVNGMPVGTSGKGILLLSGGIDSPVAGFMMAKRGMSIRALHFHSYPFTSLQAKEKVYELAKILKEYTINLTIDVVNVAEIQTKIHELCPEEFMITLLRRFMMRIAERLVKQHNAQAIITGESLGQVASQTIEGLTSTSSVTTIPILRPLIGFDKDEIVEIAKKINTFETSIKPFEDCCTAFLPKSPSIHPKLKMVEHFEEALDIETLVNSALTTIETITF